MIGSATPSRHRYRRRLLPTILAVAALVASAPNAFAHATLEETTPANGAVVDTPPAAVALRFNEHVETSLGSIRVFDGAARRVDTGVLHRAGDASVSVGLQHGLPDGTYTVAWRVVSADSHPVHGAFVFHVGAASAGDAGLALAQLPDTQPPSWVDKVFGGIRFAGFALMLIVIGGVAVLAWVLPAHPPDVRRSLVRMLTWAAALLVPVSLAAIVLQAADAGATGLGAALAVDPLRSVADTAFGQAWFARALFAAALVPVLWRGGRGRRYLAAILATLLAVTPAYAGHAHAEGPAIVVVDAVHVAAAGAWAGGLAVLVLALWRSGGRRWQLAATAVPRFSEIAAVSVLALIVVGVISAYLQTRSVTALIDTAYGRLVLLKVALLIPILVMAAFNNLRSVPALESGTASPAIRRRFVRLVSGELALIAAVLAVTAALVAEPPGRTALAATAGPASATAEAGPFEVNIVVDPARPGANAVHLYLLDRQTGQPAAADDASLAASLPSAQLGPLQVDLRPAGPGHYVAAAADLPLAGAWRLTVGARVGDFNQYDTVVDVRVRGG